jgi:hypothetical protein
MGTQNSPVVSREINWEIVNRRNGPAREPSVIQTDGARLLPEIDVQTADQQRTAFHAAESSADERVSQ